MAHIFHHDAINSKDEYRLVVLKAGADGDDLRCDIVTASFGDGTRKYVALSYAWGSDTKDKQLITSDGPLPITESLDSALRCLRARDEDVLLWADAVCINQGDNQEKVHQVRRMRDIFAGAELVRVHLGEERDDSELVPALLETMTTIDTAAVVGIEKWRSGINLARAMKDDDRGLLSALTDAAWEALRALLRRPWFRRVWIVQEFTVAKHVVFHCGGWDVDWRTLAVTIDKGIRLGLGQFLVGPGYTKELELVTRQGRMSMWSLAKLRAAYQDGRKTPLVNLLTICKEMLATRARDHLFAMLGLAEDAGDTTFDPDYDEPLVQVICRYGAALVRLGHGAKLLAEGGITADNFPSWVPNWTTPRPGFETLTMCTEDPATTVYSAGGRSSWLNMTAVGTDQATLEMSGSFFDVIARVGSWNAESPAQTRQPRPLGLVCDWLNEAEAITANLTTYPTGESVERAFRRTLISDRRKTDVRAPNAFPDEYARAREALQPRADRDADEHAVQQWHADTRAYLERIFAVYVRTRFCVTEKGYMGLCAIDARAGDLVFILPGMQMPYAMRRTSGRGDDQLRLVGQCYIHGIMDGEALTLPSYKPGIISIW